DRVFMDVPTPELDGLEVTAEIRRCEGEHDRRLPREALPCDLDDLARNYDDDPDAIRSLLEMFLPRATELVERMESAARRGDHEALRRDAHALRGISGTVRAQRLFARLERDATELDLSA